MHSFENNEQTTFKYLKKKHLQTSHLIKFLANRLIFRNVHSAVPYFNVCCKYLA